MPPTLLNVKHFYIQAAYFSIFFLFNLAKKLFPVLKKVNELIQKGELFDHWHQYLKLLNSKRL